MMMKKILKQINAQAMMKKLSDEKGNTGCDKYCSFAQDISFRYRKKRNL